MPKRRVFNSSLAWLAAARATEKLRNSGGVAHIADFVRNGMLPCVTLGTMTVASGEITGRDCLKRGRAAMAEFDDELDMQRELDTRDSLASMAHYHVSSPSAVTTQVLPPSFIPTATGRIRPVTGTIPAIQSDAQEKQAQIGRSVRSIRSLAAGSLRKSQDFDADGSTDGNGNSGSITPRIASSAPHYVD